MSSKARFASLPVERSPFENLVQERLTPHLFRGLPTCRPTRANSLRWDPGERKPKLVPANRQWPWDVGADNAATLENIGPQSRSTEGRIEADTRTPRRIPHPCPGRWKVRGKRSPAIHALPTVSDAYQVSRVVRTKDMTSFPASQSFAQRTTSEVSNVRRQKCKVS